jgi:hypothetical protein
MSDLALDELVGSALSPGRFFVAPQGRLRIERVERVAVPFEIFRGHLLDPAHTREVREFAAWEVYLDESSADASNAPLISLLWDAQAARLFVTRQILVHAHEAYEDAPGVILTRPVEKWVRELVGTLDRARLLGPGGADELSTCLLLAVVGVSRLPITSLESPLPAFSLGLLGYLPSLLAGSAPHSDAVAMLAEMLDGTASNRATIDRDRVVALEIALRAVGDDRESAIVDVLLAYLDRDGNDAAAVAALFVQLFNQVALSPYTGFVRRTSRVLDALSRDPRFGRAAATDLVATLLVNLCRHLTAFDLALFHSFGANYPDALLLDELLKLLLRQADADQTLFIDVDGDAADAARVKRSRRRALRQACLARRHYAGQRVPDSPTSMGENARVLPAPFVRVPQEQIVEVSKRTRRLFADDPLDGLLSPVAKRLLQASMADLQVERELAELGMAYFVDRPLGATKGPGEVDRTPLVSCRAVSRTVAKRRLAELKSAGWISEEARAELSRAVDAWPAIGVRGMDLSPIERPGVVSLADAAKTAGDFAFVQSSGRSLRELAGFYDLTALARLAPEVAAELATGRGLLVHGRATGEPLPTVAWYDRQGRLRIKLAFDSAGGAVQYVERSGVELPARLCVAAAWEVDASGDVVERPLGVDGVWLHVK